MDKSLEKMTNEELALSYIAGNNNAFDLLLDRIKGDVFSYILFSVHDRDKADDIFQETFVKIIVRLQEGRYCDSGKFIAWVIRIAHNVIMDWFRDQRIQTVYGGMLNDGLQKFSTSVFDTSCEEDLVSLQIQKDAYKIMMQLPEKQREVVFMRCFQDLSFKEIADTTGVSINTALGRMRYGIMNMRKLAKQYNIQLA